MINECYDTQLGRFPLAEVRRLTLWPQAQHLCLNRFQDRQIDFFLAAQ